jgi:hypothetical protein
MKGIKEEIQVKDSMQFIGYLLIMKTYFNGYWSLVIKVSLKKPAK